MKRLINEFNKTFATDIQEKSERRRVVWPRHIYLMHCHDVLFMTYREATDSLGIPPQAAWWAKGRFPELCKKPAFLAMVKQYQNEILEKPKV